MKKILGIIVLAGALLTIANLSTVQAQPVDPGYHTAWCWGGWGGHYNPRGGWGGHGGCC